MVREKPRQKRKLKQKQRRKLKLKERVVEQSVRVWEAAGMLFVEGLILINFIVVRLREQ